MNNLTETSDIDRLEEKDEDELREDIQKTDQPDQDPQRGCVE